MAKKLVDKVVYNDHDSISPLRVAFACNDKTLCERLLKFLKEILREPDELKNFLTDTNRSLLHTALSQALLFKEIEMLQKILVAIKSVFGQDLFNYVLNSENCKKEYIPLICKQKECFEVIAKVIVVNDNDGWRKLNDFVFLNEDRIEDMLEDTVTGETLHQMISADRMENWLKRFIGKANHGLSTFNEWKYGLTRLRDILERNTIPLNKDVRSQLIEFVIAMVDGGIIHFQEWIGHPDFNSAKCFLETLQIFFGCILNKGKDELKKVLFYNDGVPITRIILFYDQVGSVTDDIRKLFKQDLSDMNIFSEHVVEQSLQLIPQLFKDPEHGSGGLYLNNSIKHFKDCETITKDQLTKLIDIILIPHYLPNGTTSTIFNDYVMCNEKYGVKYFYMWVCEYANDCGFIEYICRKVGESDAMRLWLHDGGQTITRLLMQETGALYPPQQTLSEGSCSMLAYR